MAFTITADSKPLYDSFGFDDYWSCQDWINWHIALVKKYGVDKANKVWIDAWLDGVSTAGGGRGVAPGSNAILDSVPLDCRSVNSGFRDYIKRYKPLYDGVHSGLAGVVVKPIGVATDIIGSASNIVSDAGDTAETIAKVLKVAIPLAIGTALVLGGVFVYKKVIAA